MIVLARRVAILTTSQKNKRKKKTEKKRKNQEKNQTNKQKTHKLANKQKWVGWGGMCVIYIQKYTIIFVDLLFASLQIIIHSLPTVKYSA